MLALLRELEMLVKYVEAGGTPDFVAAHVSAKTLKSVLDEMYLKVIPAEAKFEYLHLTTQTKAARILAISDWLRLAWNFIAVKSSKSIVAITSTTRQEVRKVLKV